MLNIVLSCGFTSPVFWLLIDLRSKTISLGLVRALDIKANEILLRNIILV